MNYYEKQEQKNEELVEAWGWSIVIIALGSAVVWFGCWFVRLFS